MLKEITTRRSIRKYTDKPVDDEIILTLLESARLAPSGSNTQPWRFIVIKSEETRKRLAAASHNQNWMVSAPVHIVCAGDIRCRISEDTAVELYENSPLVEAKQIIRDTAIAVEHMVLTAERLGLGTCWVADFTQEDIRPVVNIPEDKYIICVLTVGYPAEQPKARPRKKLEEIIHYEKW
jgi:nitroreductase